jgi:hypothetical protein
MSDQAQFCIPCAICKQPVVIDSKSSKANEFGKTVHEDCYVTEVTSGEPKRLEDS